MADLTSAAGLSAFADRVSSTLDQRNYYQLLNLAPNADGSQVRRAFYGIAAQLHPDRFQALADPHTRDRLERIYARISEAYRVLSNTEKRAAYDRSLPEGKLRYDFAQRDPQAPRNPEDNIKNADAKRFFRMGMTCLARKDWKGAIMNFNFAKTYDATSPVIAEKLAQAQAAAQAGAAK
jgi:curved DNA-binding protein CbpA